MEGVISLDFGTVARISIEGADPAMKVQAAVHALKQTRIFEAEAAIILATAVRQFQPSVFINTTA